MTSFATTHDLTPRDGSSPRARPPGHHHLSTPFSTSDKTLSQRSDSHRSNGNGAPAPPEVGKPKTTRSPWLSAPLILGNEVAANVAYYSISTNMVIYLKNQLEYDDAVAAQLSSGLIGMAYTAVLLGGYLADARLGRAWTVLGSSATYVVGLSLLTLSAVFNTHATAHQQDRAFFFVANVLIALGGGGIKPNVSALGADQFDDFNADGTPSTAKTVFFSWYYFFINIGALLAATVLVWIQTSGRWVLGFGVPTVIFVVALAAYIAGWRGYRKLPPGGPPLARIFRTVKLAIRNRRDALPADPLDLYEAELDDTDPCAPPHLAHTQSMRWLDKAAIVPDGVSWPLLGDPPPTEFVPVSQVEETKQMLRLLPVWCSLLPWNLCYAQMASIMVQQAEQMNRSVAGSSFMVPPASMTIFATLTIIVLVPAYDKLVRPFLERHSAVPTTLQRVGLSNAMMAVAMATAAAVEAIATAHTNAVLEAGGHEPELTVFALVPQFVLMGVSEFFFVGAIEFFYQQSPERTRSLAAAMELLSYGMASFLNSAFIGAIAATTDWLPGSGPARLGRLEYYYGLLTLIALVNLALFIWPISAKYTYREFAPPSHNDAATVGLGRSIAGPALAHAKSTTLHAPLSRQLSRTPTIMPYAASTVKTDRLARALSRNASMSTRCASAGATPRTASAGPTPRATSAGRASRSNTLSTSGGGIRRSGTAASRASRVSFADAADAAVAANAARAAAAQPPPPSPRLALTPADLARISEMPRRPSELEEYEAGAKEEGSERPPKVDE